MADANAQIKVTDKGANNAVSLPRRWKLLRNSQIHIAGDNNAITIGENCRFDDLTIVIKGNNNTLKVGDNVLGTGAFSLTGSGTLMIGDNSTIGRCVMTAYKSTISIGKDCMFAQGLEIRTTDSHPVFDLDTRKRINGDRDVVIEDYVWCGARVTVMKGARIAKSSVVALGSIVTRQFEPFSLIGGYPAKVLRKGVTWTRRTHNEILEEDDIAMMYTADWVPAVDIHERPWWHKFAQIAWKAPEWVGRLIPLASYRRKL
ncbi:hypothetical protein BMJ34_04900 [Sinorhizobium medicae]|uniref:acyltransferase n=1 Tax=Sinorhizobium medicae TaxID=110321 RepID=UPI000C7C24BF|nr:acyltransferase [Sinorhizobium medicae]PLU07113.1 hypothetical protein BMJ34_04900 [Sinorhizobium medicae]PLU22972.1 hypothetical protein BMJ30_03510 [Sinorhizobium medicae]PLU33531.1 hypothetical protein BMJ27_16220 [Sinorhizobium medicae]